MSIFATFLSLSDNEHADGCAIYVEEPPGSGTFEFSGNPCDCGTPRAPLVYEGSHVLPSDSDRRGGDVQLALIPDHITRNGRDDGGEGLHDWLRLDVSNNASTLQSESGGPYHPAGDASVVLTRSLVVELRDALSWWLESEERG